MPRLTHKAIKSPAQAYRTPIGRALPVQGGSRKVVCPFRWGLCVYKSNYERKNMENQNMPDSQKPAPVLIEQTAKKWKKLQLAGVLLFIIFGVAVLVSPNAFTILMLVAAVAIYVWGRFGAWWHHR